jgi:hypothetical protein
VPDSIFHPLVLIVYGCGLLGILALFSLIPLVLVRLAMKWLIRGHWKKWYVRRASDVAVVSCCALYLVSQWSRGMPKSIDDQICNIPKFCEQPVPKKLAERYCELENMAAWAWVLDQIPLFVITPTILVLLVGYTLERQKQESKPRQ